MAATAQLVRADVDTVPHPEWWNLEKALAIPWGDVQKYKPGWTPPSPPALCSKKPAFLSWEAIVGLHAWSEWDGQQEAARRKQERQEQIKSRAPKFFLSRHRQKLEERGFKPDHLQLFWDRRWVRSVNNEQIHNGLLEDFPSAKGVKGAGIQICFNETSKSLKLDNPPLGKDGKTSKYLYAFRDKQQHPKGYNTQPWFPPGGETKIITEGFFDAAACTFLAGVNCAAATAPSHLKRSKLPKGCDVYIGDADCPFHHSNTLLSVMLDGAVTQGIKLACLPPSPEGNYLYTDGKIPENCKWGMEEWIQEWKRQGCDPKAEIEKVAATALAPVPFLQKCITDAKALGIRWPEHQAQIKPLARAIADATSDKTEQTALRDLLIKQFRIGSKTPVNDLIKARTAAKEAKAREEAAEQRARDGANGVAEPEDPFAIWDEKPLAVHASNLVRQQRDPLLRRVNADEVLYRYDPDVGFWRRMNDFETRRLVRPLTERCYKAGRDADGNLTQRFRYGSSSHVSDVCTALAETADAGNPSESRNFLTFANGTVDLRTMELQPFSPDHGTTHHLAVDLQLTDECPMALQHVINTCYGEEATPLIRAFLRWVLDLSMPWEMLFYCLGGSRSGKGILLELAESLLPQEFTSSLKDPSELANADKIGQYVEGKRLVVFPEVKPNAGRDRDWSNLLQLASHSRVTTRRLRSSDSANHVHDVRLVLAGVDVPDLGKDSTQGLAQRARYLRTLPRKGDPDPTLKEDLIGDTTEHATIRGKVIGWALSMDKEHAIAALNDETFKEARVELQAYSDPVSLFIDQCLEPADQLVAVPDRQLLHTAFGAWCEVTNSSFARRGYTEHTLIGQIRKVLPATHEPRRSFTAAECEARGLKPKTKSPAFDWGYKLRDGLVRAHSDIYRHSHDLEMNSSKRGEGGISAIVEAVQMPELEALEEAARVREGEAESAENDPVVRGKESESGLQKTIAECLGGE